MFMSYLNELTELFVASYWYNFDTNYWSAIYKHKANKHLKWKAGYESDNRLGWASLWVRRPLTFYCLFTSKPRMDTFVFFSFTVCDEQTPFLLFLSFGSLREFLQLCVE